MRRGYAVPTPVQSKAIPAALAGNDIVATAQTGTGKTLAFACPSSKRCCSSPPPPVKPSAPALSF
ncbi:MAG: DEAD/DEAH box helicase [Bryobacterales bacterium]|nr:DEAD/DEAH box helicase [Bryobacterales bacterium]